MRINLYLAQCSSKKDSQAALLCKEVTGQERQKIDDHQHLGSVEAFRQLDEGKWLL